MIWHLSKNPEVLKTRERGGHDQGLGGSGFLFYLLLPLNAFCSRSEFRMPTGAMMNLSKRCISNDGTQRCKIAIVK